MARSTRRADTSRSADDDRTAEISSAILSHERPIRAHVSTASDDRFPLSRRVSQLETAGPTGVRRQSRGPRGLPAPITWRSISDGSWPIGPHPLTRSGPHRMRSTAGRTRGAQKLGKQMQRGSSSL